MAFVRIDTALRDRIKEVAKKEGRILTPLLDSIISAYLDGRKSK